MLIVLDTNVIVSGLINPHGAPARLIDLLLSTAVQLAYDDRILAEYEEVLSRPVFGFSTRDIDALLDHIRLFGLAALVADSPLRDCPDPSDLPFAEVALASHADALVTGNAAHFDFLRRWGVRVVAPAEFIASL
ncbi:MAG: putative toxin-antitoxin system toxin component, PIN family [Chloroflexota bacterium]